jgi:hypothetical protein
MERKNNSNEGTTMNIKSNIEFIKMNEEVELIDMNEEAASLTDEQLNAMLKVPELKEQLSGEIEYCGSLRDAVYNCLQVYTDNGRVSVEDIDGLLFNYTWNESKKAWKKTS